MNFESTFTTNKVDSHVQDLIKILVYIRIFY